MNFILNTKHSLSLNRNSMKRFKPLLHQCTKGICLLKPTLRTKIAQRISVRNLRAWSTSTSLWRGNFSAKKNWIKKVHLLKKKHLTVNLIFKSINDFILSSLTKKNAVSSLLTSRMTFHLLSRMEISRNKRDMADYTRR